MLIANRPSVKKAISLVPLIDVIFILVLFFMLSTNYQLWSLLTLSQVQSLGQLTSMNQATTIELMTGKVYRIDQTNLNSIPALMDYLDASDHTQLFIQVSNEATVQDLIALMEALESNPKWQVKLLP